MATTTSELACTYAAQILHDDGIDITAEKISKLVQAANVNVESYWPSLFAKLCEKKNIDDLIMNVGASGGAAAPVATNVPAAAQVSPAAEETNKKKKKEEVKEESEDDMVFGLFD